MNNIKCISSILFFILFMVPNFAYIAHSDENQGFNLEIIEELDAEITNGNFNYIDGILIMHKGKVLFNKRYDWNYRVRYVQTSLNINTQRSARTIDRNYYNPRWYPWLNLGNLHALQSGTKSVISALIGIAILRNEIPSVHVKIKPYLDNNSPFKGDVRADKLTLEHLLTMTDGILWDESDYTNYKNDYHLLEKSPDWLEFIISKPFINEPGEVFNYNGGSSFLLEVILQKATGKTAEQYAQEHLFGPLGIEQSHWKKTPLGRTDTQAGLYLSLEGFAKIGKLYANDGIWEGKRILPAGWVKASHSPSSTIKFDETWEYGYQWWLYRDPNDENKLIPVASGYGGQDMVILPEDDLVGVIYGWNVYEDTPEYPVQDFISYLLKAAR